MQASLAPVNFTTNLYGINDLDQLTYNEGSLLNPYQIQKLIHMGRLLVMEIVQRSYSENKDDQYGLVISHLQGKLAIIEALLSEHAELAITLPEEQPSI